MDLLSDDPLHCPGCGWSGVAGIIWTNVDDIIACPVCWHRGLPPAGAPVIVEAPACASTATS